MSIRVRVYKKRHATFRPFILFSSLGRWQHEDLQMLFTTDSFKDLKAIIKNVYLLICYDYRFYDIINTTIEI